MKAYHILAILLCQLSAFAQDDMWADSIRRSLDTNLSQKERIDALNLIGYYYCKTDSVKTSEYATEAILLSKPIKYWEGLYKAYFSLAWSRLNNGKIDKSRSLFDTSISYAKKNDEINPADSYLGKGISFLMTAEFDKAEELLNESILKAEIYNSPKATGTALNYLGVIYDQRGDFQKGRTYFEKALEVLLAINDRQGLAIVYNSIGNNEYMQKNSSKALEFYLKSLKIKEELNDIQGMSKAYNNIGSIYDRDGKRLEALPFYYKSLKIKRKINDKRGMAYTMGNIANIIKNYDSIAKAEQYLLKAVKLHEEVEYNFGVARGLYMLGTHYDFTNDFGKAYEYYVRSLNLSKEIGVERLQNSALNKLAENSLQSNDFTKAKEWSEKSLNLAKKRNDLMVVSTANLNLSRSYKGLGEFELALNLYEKHKQADDSLRNKEDIEKLNELQETYEFEQEMDSLSMAQENERIVFQAEIDRRKINQRSTLFVLGVLSIAFVTIFFFNRKLTNLNRAFKVQNEEISLQKRELEDLNKMKSRFFSIISHDLRNPMSALISINTLTKRHLKEQYDTSNDHFLNEMMNHFENSSSEIIKLLDNLLKWAMKEEGVLPYKPESVNLQDAFNQVNGNLALNLALKEINLHIKAFDDLLVWADKNSLMTILRNLVSNAIKFTPNGGEILLCGNRNNGFVEIEVKDSGVGISKDKVGQLFSLDVAKVSKGTAGERGTGLGLRLVNDFVKMNNGKIEVHSVVDQGTSFKMQFPTPS